MNLRKHLGAALKRRRMELGYTLGKTAQMAKITQQSLWRIESGQQNFTIDVLDSLCGALNMNIADLIVRALGDDPGPAMPPSRVVLHGGADRVSKILGDALGAGQERVKSIDAALDSLSTAMQTLQSYKTRVYGD